MSQHRFYLTTSFVVEVPDNVSRCELDQLTYRFADPPLGEIVFRRHEPVKTPGEIIFMWRDGQLVLDTCRNAHMQRRRELLQYNP